MPLPAPTESPRPLWERWRREGDAQARDELARHYQPYARIVAATYYARRLHDDIGFDEYLQLASLGLLEAMERFDPDVGVQFQTFAARRMHGAILDGLDRLTEKNRQIAVRRKLRQERVQALKEDSLPPASQGRQPPATGAGEGAEALFRRLAEVGIGLALGVLLEDTGMVAEEPHEDATAPASVSPEVRYFQKAELQRLRQALRALVDRLPTPERNVVFCHYLQEMTFGEIAARQGVTRSRISQLHGRALLLLREMAQHNPHIDASW